MDPLCVLYWALASVIAMVLAYRGLTGRRRFTHMPSLEGKHVVITGGSSGIGLCIAQQCAAEGAYVTLMARTASKLLSAKRQIITSIKISPDAIQLKPVDVSNAEAVSVAIHESFQWRPIDVLVCSAGILEANYMEDVKPSKLEEIARTNILGCMFPIQAVIPLLKTRSKNHPSSIVIIGSMSACVFLYGSNMYTASKSALKGFAEMLKFELLPFRIGVTISCPAFTQTPMLEEVEADASGFIELGEKIYKGAFKESPEEVARLTIEGFKRNDFFVSTTFKGMMIRVIGRGFIPADSFLTCLLELLLLIPVRLLSILWACNAKHVLLTHSIPTKHKP